jgi:F0F1-type ATP synthase membrane subunit c/vacuolar-type H+-ATPase subunit K
MRALCGAIITAAALIGLGLTAQGIGQRYTMERAYYSEYDRPEKESDAKGEAKDARAPTVKPARVKFGDMDRPLIFTLVFLTCMAIVGLGIAFMGLAYHHARREREFLWEKERAAAHQRTTV